MTNQFVEGGILALNTRHPFRFTQRNVERPVLRFGKAFDLRQNNMAVIHLETVIAAPRERVFDLARSIDAHQDTAEGTSERAVAGVTSGLLGPEQEVTWEARHFGVTQRLRVKMTRFDRPRHFQDVMVEGAFNRMKHDHSFEERDGQTVMTDRFEFHSPLGWVGAMVDRLFLAGYMRRFIVRRNAILKRTAESDAWHKYLKSA